MNSSWLEHASKSEGSSAASPLLQALGTPTLHDRMFPKVENVSYRALLSMESSRFLMKTFPTPDFLSPGSRWDHMMRMGRPLITSKFMVSRARSAGKEGGGEGSNRDRSPSHPAAAEMGTGIRD